MNPYRYARGLAWSGVALLIGTIFFWGVLGQNIPPYSPALGAEEFAAEIRAHAPQIRIGMILQMPISVMWFTWGVALWVVMRAIEKENGSNEVLSTMQIWGAGFTTIVFVLPCSVWLAVAYRPEVMDAKTLQIMYDFGWMFFDMAYTLTTMQMVAWGMCMLQDRRADPLVPAWAVWFTMFTVVSFLLLTMMPLVYDGPFSRSGLLNYFVEFGLFFLMWIIVAFYTLKSITRLEQEHRAASASS
jgi:hypothetical protein